MVLLGENPLPCLFQLLKVTHISYLVLLPLYIQAQQCRISQYFQSHISLSYNSWERFCAFKNPCDWIVPTWEIWTLLPNLSFQLSCLIIISFAK